ncbi:MAG: hypothetical protein ACP5K2_04940 [bacterium]
MSKVLVERKVYVDLPSENPEILTSTTPYKVQHRWIRLFLASVLLVSMLTISLIQVRLYSELVHYQGEIRSLEEAIDNLLTGNEKLRLEAKQLISPTRLREEGKRLGLQPSDKVIILPTN